MVPLSMAPLGTELRLDKIQAAGGALTLAELSRKLGMERSAVESIVEMLNRKKNSWIGRLATSRW